MLLTVLCVIGACLLVVKVLFKLTNGVCRSNTCLVGKTALVTGGNSGIGYETALGLAARGCRVIVASRTTSDQLVADIRRCTNNPLIIAKRLDLASLASVRAFAGELLATEERLDILVNNSGVAGLGNTFTADGIQSVMQVNHFGPFLLTHLLIPLLKRSDHARIIFVSSMLAFTHNLSTDLDHLNNPYKQCALETSKLIDFRVYSNSKFCNIVAARYFARRLKGTGITANAVHPGVVRTPIYDLAFERHVPQFCTAAFYALLGFVLKDAIEGAQTTLHAALAGELRHATGKYLWDCVAFFTPPAVRNRDLCQKIIAESVRLVQLTDKEMLIV